MSDQILLPSEIQTGLFYFGQRQEIREAPLLICSEHGHKMLASLSNL